MRSALHMILILGSWSLTLHSIGFAQTDEQKLVREGNKLYKEKKYTEAEKNYMNALGKQSNSYRGAFNLGDAYYQQGKYKEAAEQFEMLTKRQTSNDTLAKAYHNLGNSYLKQKEFEKSINAYKNSLKKNTTDEDSRYNLAYAQKMLKKQQEQQKKDQEKKEQEKKDQEKKEDEKNRIKMRTKTRRTKKKRNRNLNKIYPKKMLSGFLRH